MNKAILILDCGATNVKACLVDEGGVIISSHSLANKTIADPYFKGGLIWDIDDIWNKLLDCSKKVCSEAINTEIIAVTVTTFGVDGAPVKKNGEICYPVISWQCSRTENIEKNILKYYQPEWLYQTTGLQSYHFNTIFKLIWLRENRPDVLDETDYWLFMPSLIIYRLTGEFVTDTTMAGTSMLTDNKRRNFSEDILKPLGLDKSQFPSLAEPGTIVGNLKSDVAEALGIQPRQGISASPHSPHHQIKLPIPLFFAVRFI